ncbi:MAG: hypothetical protein QMD92_00195 [bacterium]|nr:hypothetical protein [bacterium]
MEWIYVSGFNTAPGFREWLTSKGVRTRQKQDNLINRLTANEVILFGSGQYRMRFELKDGVGIFYIERKLE